MRLLAWKDGNVIEASQLRLEHPYVMQRIHTLGHKAYNVAQHVELLREGSMTLFGFASRCGAADAQRIIDKLLEVSRVSPSLSTPVVMRIDSTGDLSFEVETPLYNSGICLRAKRLIGEYIKMSHPEVNCQTSLTLAMDAMAESMVKWHGGDTPIWVDADNNVISLPWRPIFAIYNNQIYTPAELNTVAYTSVIKAIKRLELDLNIRVIPADSLQRMDEVFIADIMAVTSLSAIQKSRLLSVVTSRIVDRMEPK